MLGWLYRMIVGRFTSCSHKWVIYKTIQIFSSNQDREANIPCRHDYMLLCSKCGILEYKKGE